MDEKLIKEWVFHNIFKTKLKITEPKGIMNCFCISIFTEKTSGEKIFIYEIINKDFSNISNLYFNQNSLNSSIFKSTDKLVVSFSYSHKKLNKAPSGIFDNLNYGIIGEKKDNFFMLSETFGKTPWINIKNFLNKKGYNVDDSFNLYTFKTFKITDTILNLTLETLKYYCFCIGKFFNENYHYFLPYKVKKKKDFLIITREPNEISRNLTSLNSLLLYDEKINILQENTKRKIKNDLKSYNIISLTNNQYLFFSKINDVLIESNINELHTTFQFGENILNEGLLNSNIQYDSNHYEKITNELEKEVISLQTVIKLNYTCKEFKNFNKDRYLKIFVSWFKKFYKDDLETEYLLICFDFICNNRNCYSVLDDYLLTIFFNLKNRFNTDINLFQSLTGEIRTDFSTRFLNSVYSLNF